MTKRKFKKMSKSVIVANILLVFHIILNLLLALLSIPTIVLYIIDMIIDSKSRGVDNYLIGVYLVVMGFL